MTTYTFTITNIASATQAVTVNFTDTDDKEAARKAEQLRKVFNAKKEHCHLTRNAPTPRVPRQPNSFRRNDPIGPCIAIPILINNKWFTPNGMPIYDIHAYKARVIANAQQTRRA